MTTLRPVTPLDIDLICHHRLAIFQEAGQADSAKAAAPGFRRWLEPRLADGRYFGFVAETDGDPIGGAGLMEIDWPPHPAHPLDDRRGYVLNVFVEPAHRGRGVAAALMQASDDAFASRGLAFAVLHATEAGRPIYDRAGWFQTAEMAKRYDAPPT